MTDALQDYDLYRKAKAIREWLVKISGLTPRLNEDPNPFYNCTIQGLVLVAYYGSPAIVGTPCGGWTLSGGGVLRNPRWLEEATDRLGLVEIVPEVQTVHGCTGPVWKITKDLDGNTLPEAVFNVVGPAPATGYTTESLFAKEHTEFFHAYDILKGTWQEIKTKINFVACDDQVLPDWVLNHLVFAEDLGDVHSILTQNGIGVQPGWCSHYALWFSGEHRGYVVLNQRDSTAYTIVFPGKRGPSLVEVQTLISPKLGGGRLDSWEVYWV